MVKLLWLAICNMGRPSIQRTAPSRLIEGHTTTNWRQALGQLAIAYPDRINPYL